MRWRAYAGWTLICSMCTAPSITSATTNPTGSSWSSTAAQARPAFRYPDRDSAGSGGLSATLLIPTSRNASPAASWIACSRPTSPGPSLRIGKAADRDAMTQKYDIGHGQVINRQPAWVHSRALAGVTARIHRRGLPGWTGGQQRPAPGRGGGRRHRRAGGRVLPARRPGRSPCSRGRRGSAASWPSPRSPGSRLDEGAEALLARRPGGDRPDPRGRPGRPARRPGHHGRADLDPRPAAGRCRGGSSWECPPTSDDAGPRGMLSAAGLARARRDAGCPPRRGTATCRWPATSAARFGPEVVDRLVDPLLGGVYAGRSEELSFEATLPGAGRGGPPAPRRWPRRRARCCRRPRRRRARAARRRPPSSPRCAGGLGTLPPVRGRGVRGARAHRRDGPRAGADRRTAGG